MLKPKTFAGANVFMSRNLVAPEIFDAVHDALKQNGAEVFLCCDPSRNGPNDYHVISSADHEKFEDLRAKGCNLLGPQCVLSCAKEHRPLPQQGFTCCLAMDGVKILASGFQADEKVEIGKLVTAMGGVLHTKASLDVSFVIVKNVLAAKYKWALNISKKPIVTIGWLQQCWIEHRVVPQEAYRVLPFSGLNISVSRIPADERKEIEKLILQNGGRYCADLTRKCTHLICNAPEGDKYKVARTWGHINIVTRKWFDQSVARRACLNEESYPVGSVGASNKMARGCLTAQNSQDKVMGNLQAAPSSLVADSNFSAVSGPGFSDMDLEPSLSQNTSMFSDATHCINEVDVEVPVTTAKTETYSNNCITSDFQSEDNDLYLSACRIKVVGFEASELRKIVNMIRGGGGSRFILSNNKLTHIIVGNLSEMEKKEVRDIAASGVIHVVRTTWLEDCDRQKKEIPVLGRHMAYDALIPKASSKASTIDMDQNKVPIVHPTIPSNELEGSIQVRIGKPSMIEEKIEEKSEANVSGDRTMKLPQKRQPPVSNGINKSQEKMRPDFTVQNGKSSCVFKGKIFCFSSSFPEDRRAEIVEWINQGGGKVVEDHMKQKVHFTVECHGVTLRSSSIQTIYVSSHWVRSCLEDGCLWDTNGHILYSPLPCCVPLSGFENIRFCVSQYGDKDRVLLRNLCFVLGAKFVEKLTKKVTHLICKFSNGPKYEAACKWGIHSTTAEWIYECVRQSKIVSLDLYRPKEVTAQDTEAGLCTVSQFPTQAVQMIARESQSQFPIHSAIQNDQSAGTIGSSMGEVKQLSYINKKPKLLDEAKQKCPLFVGNSLTHSDCNLNSTKETTSKSSVVTSHVPDVASAIEDLLEQTSKIHDLKSPGRKDCNKSIFPSDCSIVGQDQDHSESHPIIGLSNPWLKRTERKEEIGNPTGDGRAGIYDGFSETQTESQVVGYEEDLSGRQMLIDRVRTWSSTT
ncbi:DNA topoisomerase 2-binding protein 1 [Momordica charantia]|uniref:DNA topoisomerase 2-binding protein 1 n=1 Tax=Momordica charantia TaxID=3673 RepID=A0A6J1BWX2_MOMCH|nr:DNA topoisomerase 2-binding protein 1 [Momordica charantia]XP_022134028.1 DNA topoisomerase 2-binding protein 1 [Momordica charantia]XP_022134035.1 DNA topoisomerase 2-binding protein 1 [Momordica charantia]